MPRNKEQNQKIKDDRREQILSAALKLFATKGLAATKITDISASSGISQGLLYHYYKSKEEIFIWLINNALDKMNEAAANLEKLPLTGKEKICIAIEELLKGIENNENTADYYFLITQAALLDSFPEKAKKLIQEKNLIKYEIMKRIFEQGQQEGTVISHNTKELTTVFFSTINGLAINKAIHEREYIKPNKNILLNIFLKN